MFLLVGIFSLFRYRLQFFFEFLDAGEVFIYFLVNITGLQCLSGPGQRWSWGTGPFRRRLVLQGTWFTHAQGRQRKCEPCPLALHHTAYMPNHYYCFHMSYGWCTTMWVCVLVRFASRSRWYVLARFASRSATTSTAQHLALLLLWKTLLFKTQTFTSIIMS